MRQTMTVLVALTFRRLFFTDADVFDHCVEISPGDWLTD